MEIFKYEVLKSAKFSAICKILECRLYLFKYHWNKWQTCGFTFKSVAYITKYNMLRE